LFILALVALALFFSGSAYLYLAMGPLEARARKGPDRLYAKSALISRERGQLVGAWLAGVKRYEGASPFTVAVLYGMRLLIAVLLGLKVFTVIMR
jgi:hypothetical protein